MKLLITLIVLIAICYAELVVTPFGERPSECVHEVFENEVASFDDEDQMFRIRRLTYVNGVETYEIRLELPPCHDTVPHRIQDRVFADPNGWAAYTLWLTTTPMDWFGGYWTIPSNPVQAGLQTLFLFTGFQNAYASNARAAASIIQPVLQWGSSAAGGSKYWAISSWFVGGSHATFSELKGPLNSGDIIIGNMTLASSGLWTITTTDATMGITTTLSVATAESEIDAFVTLEVYGISTCSDYPNGVDTFTQLYLEANGQHVTPVWSTQTEPGCEEAVTVNSPSSVTIQF